MALQVNFISEITTADSKFIEEWAWNGNGTSKWNKWEWPKQANLTRRHWRLWQKALNEVFLKTDSHFRILKDPLDVISIDLIHQQGGTFWTYSLAADKVYLHESEKITLFLPRNMRRNTQRSQYARTDYQVSDTPPDSSLVSVSCVNGSLKLIYLRNVSHARHLVSDNLDTPLTFNDHLRRLWKKDKWLWDEAGEFTHSLHLAQSILAGALLAVSDGSHMDMFGTSASILCDNLGNEIWMKSVTPGDGRFQHSHRSKLAGVAASLVAIEGLCSYYKIASGKATIGLDRLQAINNILVDVPNVKQADYDLVMFIRTKLDTLPLVIEFLWIKGY